MRVFVQVDLIDCKFKVEIQYNITFQVTIILLITTKVKLQKN